MRERITELAELGIEAMVTVMQYARTAGELARWRRKGALVGRITGAEMVLVL